VAGTAEGGRKSSRFTAYGLLAPGLAWLLVFFAYPTVTLFLTSVSEREDRFDIDPELTWRWANYSDAIDRYSEQFVRSFWYALAATILCLVIGYPLAYVLAFRAGRWKTLLLGLVVIPFFTTFLIRTLAWKNLLADEGPVVSLLRDLSLLSHDGRLLATPWAVIGGLTYNFLPFMVLPIYVSLEKIDPRLLEAGQDLYGTPARTFRKVVLPLSMPGLFAGSLLTFIPAAGDFINAELLGGPRTRMLGNVVQSEFLDLNDYPTAAALSFVFMAIVLIGVLVYAWALGTEDLVG
jgi:spermidine/putrescine transport system permease protein